jgi:hypothetical protein
LLVKAGWKRKDKNLISTFKSKKCFGSSEKFVWFRQILDEIGIWGMPDGGQKPPHIPQKAKNIWQKRGKIKCSTYFCPK